MPDHTLGALPLYRSQQRLVQKARKSCAMNIKANTRAELPSLTGLFQTDFLKWDSGPANDRILLFATDAGLDCLTRSEHWFADGTFKSRPLLFDQLFTIHAYKSDGDNVLCFPVAYCLTPNRTTATYRRILNQHSSFVFAHPWHLFPLCPILKRRSRLPSPKYSQIANSVDASFTFVNPILETFSEFLTFMMRCPTILKCPWPSKWWWRWPLFHLTMWRHVLKNWTEAHSLHLIRTYWRIIWTTF